MKDGTRTKGLYKDDIMEGIRQMITGDGKIVNGIWSYGVMNEDLTYKKIGCKDSLVVGIDHYARLVTNYF